MSPKVIATIFLAFAGCCCNVIILEMIIQLDKGAGNLITFAQFSFIAIQGFISTMKFGTRRPVVPVRAYLYVMFLFFITSVINNYALSFKIPIPLHIIFKSGSLLANMILGICLLQKSYSQQKYLSVVAVSVGISVCTMASATALSSEATDEAEAKSDLIDMTIGTIMVFAALFTSAYLGIFQEKLYKTHGKHPKEALFFTHALALPGFMLLYADISEHMEIFSRSALANMAYIPKNAFPVLWVLLMGNVITQYVCIRSVFVLTSECASLTVTLVITLRKFINLLFSVWYFDNAFTMQHWIGTVLVFGGSFLFSEVIKFANLQPSEDQSKPKEEKNVKSKDD